MIKLAGIGHVLLRVADEDQMSFSFEPTTNWLMGVPMRWAP